VSSTIFPRSRPSPSRRSMRKNRRTEAVIEQNGQPATGHERCHAHHRGGLRTPASGDRSLGGARQRIGCERLSNARGSSRPRNGHPIIAWIGVAVRILRVRMPKQLIAELEGLGVPVKMLTGDALPVAIEIGQGSRLTQHPARCGPEGRGRSGQQKVCGLLGSTDGFRRGLSRG